MEFFDKLTKKASETYKGAAEKTGKIAKEAKLKLKISDNKSKINDIYENAVPNTKTQSVRQVNSEMQKRQKELNEIINKYSQKQ